MMTFINVRGSDKFSEFLKFRELVEPFFFKPRPLELMSSALSTI